jgi:hypothetical protein
MPPRPPAQSADGPISGHMVPFQAHRPRDRRPDHAISDVAWRQHGLVSLEQLCAAGLTPSGVRKRVQAHRLHRVHQGVYAVGHAPLTRKTQYMAAVLACGPGAVLSHRSAAALWSLREDKRARIDVTAPGRRGRTPPRIDAHRHGSLMAADRAEVEDIPCTSVARTLLDFAAMAPVWELRQAVGEAEVRRILDKGAVRSLIKRVEGAGAWPACGCCSMNFTRTRNGLAARWSAGSCACAQTVDCRHPRSMFHSKSREADSSRTSSGVTPASSSKLIVAGFTTRIRLSSATGVGNSAFNSPVGGSPDAPGSRSKSNPESSARRSTLSWCAPNSPPPMGQFRDA